MNGTPGDVRAGNTPEQAPEDGDRTWDDGLIARRSRPRERAAEPVLPLLPPDDGTLSGPGPSGPACSAPQTDGDQEAVLAALDLVPPPHPVDPPPSPPELHPPPAPFAAAPPVHPALDPVQADLAAHPVQADVAVRPGQAVPTAHPVQADVAPQTDAPAGAGPRPAAPGVFREAPPTGEPEYLLDPPLPPPAAAPAHAPPQPFEPDLPAGTPPPPPVVPGREVGLGERLTALRELIGLSRTRLTPETLREATRVLEEAAARGRLSRAHTTVAIAGATGSGKSTLFNALAGAQLSEAGVRRPTTAAPVACVWEATERSGGADGLLERLGVPPRSRRRAHLRDSHHLGLRGLVLLDLPDHDSTVTDHRVQVDRMLKLVDAVIWVVDPEKYADAALHEDYLKPYAGHAEVTHVVLNQIDRLPGDATDEVVADLRRLLDEDGMALGEHGEPGAQVLALSALTGEGVPELRDALAELVDGRVAAARRLAADVDAVLAELRPVYVKDDPHGPEGLTEEVREAFEDRLGDAAGAGAVGQTAERHWLRESDRACGTPWSALVRAHARRQAARRGELPAPVTATDPDPEAPHPAARPVVEQAVRTLASDATRGLPEPWARAVREAAWRGAAGLPTALDEAIASAAQSQGPPRPRWWAAAAAGQAALTALQLLGLGWLLAILLGVGSGPWLPFTLLAGGAVVSPLLAWGCRIAAGAPARAYGWEQELRLRRRAAGCGRARVLEPVAAELMRYAEVRGQYVVAVGGPERGMSACGGVSS